MAAASRNATGRIKRMTSNAKPPSASPKKAKKKKKKADPFWPIVIILSILAFTGSFWFFYMLTSKINTRNFPTTDTPKLMLPASPSAGPEGTGVQAGGADTRPSGGPVGASTVASRSPAANASPARATQTASASTPARTATPTAVVTATPVSTTTTTTTQPTAFRVQVGSYNTREEAQQIAGQLSAKGYGPLVVEDSGRFRLQLGVYENEENALALAQEITQQGYEVIVRKATP